MPKLRDLEAQFRHLNSDGSSDLTDKLEGAHGVMFLCPKCAEAAKNGATGGVHSVICWFYGRVPDDLSPGPGRWQPSPQSTGLDDLTFVPHPGSNLVSVYLNAKDGKGNPVGCQWHGHVRNGEATLS